MIIPKIRRCIKQPGQVQRLIGRPANETAPAWKDMQQVLGNAVNHLSNENNSGFLGFIGDNTTQLRGDYNKSL